MIRRTWPLAFALTLLASTGCGNSVFVDVDVLAADTGLPVAGAVVKLDGQDGFSQTTDSTGVARFNGLDSGFGFVTVSAAGYQNAKFTRNDQNTTVTNSGSQTTTTITVKLTRTAPALVFHTFKGPSSNSTPQVAQVVVRLNDGTQVFAGDTVTLPNLAFAALTVPNLSPSTTYAYTVSATGFPTVTGTATTNKDATVTEVDVRLDGTIPTEFRTSETISGPNGTFTVAASAMIALTPGNIVVTTTAAGNNPFDSVTVNLQPSTTYQYSAVFSGVRTPVTGSFTTPATASTTGNFVVNINLNNAVPKALP